MWWSVFSYCGKLVSNFLVCSWLWVVAAYIKKRANLITQGWDKVITGKKLRVLLEEILDEVRRNDCMREVGH